MKIIKNQNQLSNIRNRGCKKNSKIVLGFLMLIRDWKTRKICFRLFVPQRQEVCFVVIYVIYEFFRSEFSHSLLIQNLRSLISCHHSVLIFSFHFLLIKNCWVKRMVECALQSYNWSEMSFWIKKMIDYEFWIFW